MIVRNDHSGQNWVLKGDKVKMLKGDKVNIFLK